MEKVLWLNLWLRRVFSHPRSLSKKIEEINFEIFEKTTYPVLRLAWLSQPLQLLQLLLPLEDALSILKMDIYQRKTKGKTIRIFCSKHPLESLKSK